MNQVQKYTVDGMLADGKELKEIVELTGFDVRAVRRYINMKDTEPKAKSKDEPVARGRKNRDVVEIKSTKVEDLMINRAHGGREGVKIMTEGASQVTDETKKLLNKSGAKYNKNLTKIKRASNGKS